jgi:uncharacterized protein YciI
MTRGNDSAYSAINKEAGMLFAIIGHDTPEAGELRPKLRDAHLAHLRPLVEQGKVILGGPFTDGSGMLVVLDMESDSAVKEFFAKDPFVTGKVLSSIDIKPFRKVLPPG